MEISKLEPGVPNDVNVLITSKKGSRNFCSFDFKSETFNLQRVLSRPFPWSYGFIPKTHHTGGEPLNVIVLASEPIDQGTVVQAKPIGLIRLRGRIPDDVLIAASLTDENIGKTQDLLSLDKEELDKLENFLEELKEKEVEDVFGVKHARKAVENSIKLYKEEFE